MNNFKWSCLKCGRIVIDFRRRNLKCCSEPMINGDARDRREFYYRYIVSADWKKKSDEAKKRAGHRCQVCNQSGRMVTLNTHHRTYKNLGHEKPDDLTVLCEGCHDVFHKAGRLAAIA